MKFDVVVAVSRTFTLTVLRFFLRANEALAFVLPPTPE